MAVGKVPGVSRAKSFNQLAESCLEILQTIIILWKERSYRLWVL